MPPWKLSSDAVKMIFPAPRATISLPNSRLKMNCAFKLTSMTLSQYSSGCSAAGLRRIVPALLTRMSTAGTSALTLAMNSYSASRSEKSQAYARQLRPVARTAASISLPSASSVALTPTMSAPASASATAIALPIPRFAARHQRGLAVEPELIKDAHGDCHETLAVVRRTQQRNRVSSSQQARRGKNRAVTVRERSGTSPGATPEASRASNLVPQQLVGFRSKASLAAFRRENHRSGAHVRQRRSCGASSRQARHAVPLHSDQRRRRLRLGMPRPLRRTVDQDLHTLAAAIHLQKNSRPDDRATSSRSPAGRAGASPLPPDQSPSGSPRARTPARPAAAARARRTGTDQSSAAARRWPRR